MTKGDMEPEGKSQNSWRLGLCFLDLYNSIAGRILTLHVLPVIRGPDTLTVRMVPTLCGGGVGDIYTNCLFPFEAVAFQ